MYLHFSLVRVHFLPCLLTLTLVIAIFLSFLPCTGNVARGVHILEAVLDRDPICEVALTAYATAFQQQQKQGHLNTLQCTHPIDSIRAQEIADKALQYDTHSVGGRRVRAILSHAKGHLCDAMLDYRWLAAARPCDSHVRTMSDTLSAHLVALGTTWESAVWSACVSVFTALGQSWRVDGEDLKCAKDTQHLSTELQHVRTHAVQGGAAIQWRKGAAVASPSYYSAEDTWQHPASHTHHDATDAAAAQQQQQQRQQQHRAEQTSKAESTLDNFSDVAATIARARSTFSLMGMRPQSETDLGRKDSVVGDGVGFAPSTLLSTSSPMHRSALGAVMDASTTQAHDSTMSVAQRTPQTPSVSRSGHSADRLSHSNSNGASPNQTRLAARAGVLQNAAHTVRIGDVGDDDMLGESSSVENGEARGGDNQADGHVEEGEGTVRETAHTRTPTPTRKLKTPNSPHGDDDFQETWPCDEAANVLNLLDSASPGKSSESLSPSAVLSMLDVFHTPLSAKRAFTQHAQQYSTAAKDPPITVHCLQNGNLDRYRRERPRICPSGSPRAVRHEVERDPVSVQRMMSGQDLVARTSPVAHVPQPLEEAVGSERAEQGGERGSEREERSNARSWDTDVSLRADSNTHSHSAATHTAHTLKHTKATLASHTADFVMTDDDAHKHAHTETHVSTPEMGKQHISNDEQTPVRMKEGVQHLQDMVDEEGNTQQDPEPITDPGYGDAKEDEGASSEDEHGQSHRCSLTSKSPAPLAGLKAGEQNTEPPGHRSEKMSVTAGQWGGVGKPPWKQVGLAKRLQRALARAEWRDAVAKSSDKKWSHVDLGSLFASPGSSLEHRHAASLVVASAALQMGSSRSRLPRPSITTSSITTSRIWQRPSQRGRMLTPTPRTRRLVLRPFTTPSAMAATLTTVSRPSALPIYTNSDTKAGGQMVHKSASDVEIGANVREDISYIPTLFKSTPAERSPASSSPLHSTPAFKSDAEESVINELPGTASAPLPESKYGTPDEMSTRVSAKTESAICDAPQHTPFSHMAAMADHTLPGAGDPSNDKMNVDFDVNAPAMYVHTPAIGSAHSELKGQKTLDTLHVSSDLEDQPMYDEVFAAAALSAEAAFQMSPGGTSVENESSLIRREKEWIAANEDSILAKDAQPHWQESPEYLPNTPIDDASCSRVATTHTDASPFVSRLVSSLSSGSPGSPRTLGASMPEEEHATGSHSTYDITRDAAVEASADDNHVSADKAALDDSDVSTDKSALARDDSWHSATRPHRESPSASSRGDATQIDSSSTARQKERNTQTASASLMPQTSPRNQHTPLPHAPRTLPLVQNTPQMSPMAANSQDNDMDNESSLIRREKAWLADNADSHFADNYADASGSGAASPGVFRPRSPLSPHSPRSSRGQTSAWGEEDEEQVIGASSGHDTRGFAHSAARGESDEMASHRESERGALRDEPLSLQLSRRVSPIAATHAVAQESMQGSPMYGHVRSLSVLRSAGSHRESAQGVKESAKELGDSVDVSRNNADEKRHLFDEPFSLSRTPPCSRALSPERSPVHSTADVSEERSCSQETSAGNAVDSVDSLSDRVHHLPHSPLARTHTIVRENANVDESRWRPQLLALSGDADPTLDRQEMRDSQEPPRSNDREGTLLPDGTYYVETHHTPRHTLSPLSPRRALLTHGDSLSPQNHAMEQGEGPAFSQEGVFTALRGVAFRTERSRADKHKIVDDAGKALGVRQGQSILAERCDDMGKSSTTGAWLRVTDRRFEHLSAAVFVPLGTVVGENLLVQVPWDSSNMATASASAPLVTPARRSTALQVQATSLVASANGPTNAPTGYGYRLGAHEASVLAALATQETPKPESPGRNPGINTRTRSPAASGQRQEHASSDSVAAHVLESSKQDVHGQGDLASTPITTKIVSEISAIGAPTPDMSAVMQSEYSAEGQHTSSDDGAAAPAHDGSAHHLQDAAQPVSSTMASEPSENRQQKYQKAFSQQDLSDMEQTFMDEVSDEASEERDFLSPSAFGPKRSPLQATPTHALPGDSATHTIEKVSNDDVGDADTQMEEGAHLDHSTSTHGRQHLDLYTAALQDGKGVALEGNVRVSSQAARLAEVEHLSAEVHESAAGHVHDMTQHVSTGREEEVEVDEEDVATGSNDETSEILAMADDAVIRDPPVRAGALTTAVAVKRAQTKDADDTMEGQATGDSASGQEEEEAEHRFHATIDRAEKKDAMSSFSYMYAHADGAAALDPLPIGANMTPHIAQPALPTLPPVELVCPHCSRQFVKRTGGMVSCVCVEARVGVCTRVCVFARVRVHTGVCDLLRPYQNFTPLAHPLTLCLNNTSTIPTRVAFFND